MTKKVKSLVFVLATALALLLGTKEPEQVAADWAGTPSTYCKNYTQSCQTYWYNCYQDVYGVVHQCSYVYCTWSITWGYCGCQIGCGTIGL